MQSHKKDKFKKLTAAYITLTALNCIFASIGGNMITPIIFSILKNILFMGLILLLKGELKLPSNFNLYICFVVLAVFHFFYFGGSLKLLFIFISSTFYYIVFRNLRDEIQPHLPVLVKIMSWSMTILFLATINMEMNNDVTENLFHPTSTSKHNHLGDILALAAIPELFNLINKFNLGNIARLFLYLILIPFSFSRSAVVTLGVVIFFLLKKLRPEKLVSTTTTVMIGLGVLFVVFGSVKSTLFSRPYYLNSLSLFISNPLGIGYGNFPKYYQGIEVVHSLPFEVLVGFGIFSAVFFAWLYKVIKMVIKSNNSLIIQATFIATLTNVTFDRTYLIPSVIWLMFACLGTLDDEPIKPSVQSS